MFVHVVVFAVRFAFKLVVDSWQLNVSSQHQPSTKPIFAATTSYAIHLSKSSSLASQGHILLEQHLTNFKADTQARRTQHLSMYSQIHDLRTLFLFCLLPHIITNCFVLFHARTSRDQLRDLEKKVDELTRMLERKLE